MTKKLKKVKLCVTKRKKLRKINIDTKTGGRTNKETSRG